MGENKKRKNWLKKGKEYTMSALKSTFRFGRRMLFGGERLMMEEGKSPSKLTVGAFFRRKRAVFALCVLSVLFVFVFVAPLFLKLDLNYTDPLQQNVAPVYSLCNPPKALKRQGIAVVDGFSDFTLGLSLKGEVFVWGSTRDGLTGRDMKKIPKEIEEEGAVFVAGGKDHALALTKTGKLIGWGDKSCGQYGIEPVLNALPMPAEMEKALPVEEVMQVVCGYQVSALVKKEGDSYLWGNENAVRNLRALKESLQAVKTKKIAFTNSVAVALLLDGRVTTGENGRFTHAISSKVGRINSFDSYMVGRFAVDIATNNKCLAVVLDDGELVVTGAFENGEDVLPILEEGEYFRSIEGGTRHFVGVTNLDRGYAWGDNAYGQSDVHGVDCGKICVGALQSYVLSKEGKLLKNVGLKGYLMGTDGRGRDVFTRIAHGGKMTMTVGGVAVIVSSIIAILIGCTAGYFGGWIDTLLMRVTEVFSSIPFLPFAMLLSQIIKNYNFSEGMRIFIIMLVLGALSWTGLARMIRGQVLAEREKEFVLSARAMGVKEGKIAFKHVLPNVISVILVSMTLDFAGCLLTESSLSYLGFGVQLPQPTWGNMLTGSNNSVIIQRYWWQWLFPALFLSIAVICINVIGDALRDVMDPKEKER